ncbi:MAG: protein kinase domain-containing protein [Gemmatimonadales bacterium]
MLAGRYAVVREIGRGGMATVYLAHDLQSGTDVAVKMLSPDLGPQLGPDRFTREIRITASLQHPGILPVLDTGEAEGRPFYVMPFVVGESLAQRLRREGQIPIPDALDIASQVADALALAHRQGFVHRDIKPSNILLAGDRVLLADFGIARAIDVLTNDKLTETGVALGTASYMSPEQASGGRVDGRSDIYGLGCVLFEMLAGGPPFSGGSSQSVRARHVVDPVPSLRTVRDTVTPSLERIIVKAMAKVPADRYPDAGRFRDALRRVDLTETATAITAPTRRRRRLPALAVLAALAIGVAASRLALHRAARLDPNHIMVFPLVIPAEFTGPRAVGEDVATMIGNALDGVGKLRWIDGWPLLEPAQRNDIRSLALASARALARAQRCAFFVTGRLVERGDSAEVFLELNDVAGDSVVARGKAGGTAADAWRVGLRAVNEVLPSLIPTGAVDVAADWNDRDPGAVASFLLGEAAFRRVHMTDALEHYRSAVKADSLFGLAAIRGAQAATWNHHPVEAAALIRVAMGQNLPPRYHHFALGYNAYLNGQPDSASAEFRRALAVDPELGAAWMLLGEVYTHLLPETGNPDSLAEAAFEEARRLDPQATNLLLHLIEIRLRRGELDQAEPMVRQFLAAGPDTTLAAQIRLMDRCVRRGPGQVDWRQSARADPLALLTAGNSLKGGGSHLGCAIRAFTAVLDDDTVSGAWGDARRWSALIGVQSILLAQGRATEAATRIDSAIARGLGGSSLYLIDGALAPEFEDRAKGVARQDEVQFGKHYVKCPYPNRLWVLGLWAAHRGETKTVAAIGRELESRARKSGSAYERAGARAMTAHGALALADTGRAIELLTAALSDPVRGDELEWDPAAPRGQERLQLAQLLMARGEPQRALEVATVFDSALPIVYALYLPASLRLRAEAAAALGNAALRRHYEHRLAAFRDSRAVATR